MIMNGKTVALSLPAGTSHYTWSSSPSDFNNNVPRLRQNVEDSDFEMVVKFDGTLNAHYQSEGILVEQDENDMLRLEFMNIGGTMRAFAASFTEGAASSKYYLTIPNSTPLYMRVARAGNMWTQSYSNDGSNWTALASFTHAMTVNTVGVYAGNVNLANDVTIDYVFNSASPITPEDATTHTVAVTTTGDGTVSKNPDRTSYSCGEEVTLTAVPDGGWEFSGWSGALSGIVNPETIIIDTGTQDVTGTFVETGGMTYTLTTSVDGEY
jgi:regulation of enolase protein 1 (concanavalin A-like superfamily)